MGQEISLFNDYHTKENILSNHCGVVLKLLYEENPRSFEEVISTLTAQDFMISPSFKQQIRKSESTPDIVIEQRSFSLYFETKTFDWFYENQIERHLKGFERDTTYNILFLLANFEIDNLEDKFEKQIKEAVDRFNITLCPISFEQLLGVLETVSSTDSFKKLLEEFRAFLERNDYLPTWKYMLDIVNCASTIHEVHDHNVYMCPNTGGKYQHRRALFFGGYKSKNVKYIHEIKALVVVNQGGKSGQVKWKNFGVFEDKDLVSEALRKVEILDYRRSEVQERDLQVFLLQNPAEANFAKKSDGGLYSSKKYLRNIAREKGAKTSAELAERLIGETWE